MFGHRFRPVLNLFLCVTLLLLLLQQCMEETKQIRITSVHNKRTPRKWPDNGDVLVSKSHGVVKLKIKIVCYVA